jgi:hypothetical protein
MSGFENPQGIKIGDTVFVTDDNIDSDLRGTHGVVESVDATDNSLPLRVRFTAPNGSVRTQWVREGHYSLTTPVPPEQRVKVLRPNDRVVIAATGSAWDGKEGYFQYASSSGAETGYVTFGPDEEGWFPLSQINLAVKPSEETGIITDLQKQVATLTEEVAAQKRLRERSDERVTALQNHYRHDMNAIQRIMRDKKEDQNWCDDGYNEVVDDVNAVLTGGFEFEKFRTLVQKRVRMSGNVIVTKDVWVYDDEDDDDADNWKDEDGDDLNIDVSEALCDEASNNGWDDTEITVTSLRY